MLNEPLKTTGSHTVRIKLVGQMDAHVTVVVEPEETPEAAEARERAAAAPAEEAAEEQTEA